MTYTLYSALILNINRFKAERWLSGRKRPPRKRLFYVNGIEGSNPSLSSSLRPKGLRLAAPSLKEIPSKLDSAMRRLPGEAATSLVIDIK